MRLKVMGALALALGLVAVQANAQSITTGSISGTVTDESGGVLPGASVAAVHEPTGTHYTATTDSKGHFSILNVRVGGPYTVSVTMSGFKEQKRTGASVALGADLGLDFKMKLESVTETVEVTAGVDAIINPSSTGPASNVSEQAVENLPTVARAITDFTRLSPYFASMGGGDGSGADVPAVAGTSNRYNNVQIDGANNNDLFALASNSGNPGGGTGTQPISFDAIQEIQLVVAPYDVRQGGFAGGGINAITRTGTNAFHGTAYYEFRNQGLVGDGPNSRPISTFSEKQYGASVGGPLVKDKAFFFVNADFTRNQTPSGFSADGSSGQTFSVPASDLSRYLDILKTKYGYDPGLGGNALGEFTKNTESNKIFARLDFNLSDKHRLTIRNNWTKPNVDIGYPSSSVFYTPDNYYQVHNRTNSTVAQLNSTFGSSVNELRLAYQVIRDIRTGPTQFPQVRVDLTPGSCGSSTCYIRSGTEEFSTANQLYQNILEITDDFTGRTTSCSSSRTCSSATTSGPTASAASTTSRPGWRSSTTTASRPPAIRSRRRSSTSTSSGSTRATCGA
jgi:Carboxypeptidase regulatory-like domain/TonB-dependent Receptor Plug Domain